MDYYCDVCDIFIKPRSKYNHFKSNIHKDFNNIKQTILSLKDIDINVVDEAFYLYIIERNKKFDYYLVNREFE